MNRLSHIMPPLRTPALVHVALLLMLVLSACTKSQSNTDRNCNCDKSRPVLVVSIEPQRKMLEQIVGDRFQVVSLVNSGVNPESYEPTMEQRAILENNTAFFTVGTLPFESRLVDALGDKTRIVNTSQGIDLMYGTHICDHGHKHSDVDPHTWTSLRNARIMMRNMLNTVVELDPDNAPEYQNRYDNALLRVDSLDSVITRYIDHVPSKNLSIWHPSLSYYCRDYGLNQISVGQESKDISIGQLHQIVKRAKDANVRVMFYQQEFDSRQAETISKETGARLVPFNAMAYDWDNELLKITNELSR